MGGRRAVGGASAIRRCSRSYSDDKKNRKKHLQKRPSGDRRSVGGRRAVDGASAIRRRSKVYSDATKRKTLSKKTLRRPADGGRRAPHFVVKPGADEFERYSVWWTNYECVWQHIAHMLPESDGRVIAQIKRAGKGTGKGRANGHILRRKLWKTILLSS